MARPEIQSDLLWYRVGRSRPEARADAACRESQACWRKLWKIRGFSCEPCRSDARKSRRVDSSREGLAGKVRRVLAYGSSTGLLGSGSGGPGASAAAGKSPIAPIDSGRRSGDEKADAQGEALKNRACVKRREKQKRLPSQPQGAAICTREPPLPLPYSSIGPLESRSKACWPAGC